MWRLGAPRLCGSTAAAVPRLEGAVSGAAVPAAPTATPTFAITKASHMRPLMQIGDPEESAARRWLRRGFLAGAAACVGLLYYDMGERVWSSLHCWQTALQHYVLLKTMGWLGRRRLRQFIADCDRGESLQRELLGELLQRHQRTEYGRAAGLAGVSTLEEFRERHPLTEYEHYAKHIEALKERSDEGILAPGLPRLMALSAGSGGQPKLVPRVREDARGLQDVYLGLETLGAGFPGVTANLQRSASLSFCSSRWQLPSGLVAGADTASVDDWGFQNRLCTYTSPLAVYQIEQEQDALYAHALFALKDRNLGLLEADFAPTLCVLLETMLEHRRSLVQDLRNGHIWDRLTLDSAPVAPPVRDILDAALGGPDPKRAAEVDDFLRSRAPLARLWPRLRAVVTADGGALQPAAARLRELLGDDVPVHSPFYSAAEGLLGVNVMPQRPFDLSTYVLDPGSMVYELLPVCTGKASSPQQATVLPWEAVPGQIYEVVITTRSGLCRYRLGDIVKVHGLFGDMPIVSIQGRAALTLPCLRSHSMPEGIFSTALARTDLARRTHGAVVVDAPNKLDASQYHVFAEAAAGGPERRRRDNGSRAFVSNAAAAAAATELDGALRSVSEFYDSLRRVQAVEQLKVHWVAPGAFAALRSALAESGTRTPSDRAAQMPAAMVRVPTVLRGAATDQLLASELGP